ncbi:MAG TPA: hypothetical protein VF014_08215 [Casimicrobiaceae bacterium]|nr:hypothetical protein [Casimicrobiaceae bacterium]
MRFIGCSRAIMRLAALTSEDHAEARKPKGLVDRLGALEKLTDEDEELARRAERKVAVSLLSDAVEGGHVDAKAAREALALLIDLEDHENEEGDDYGTVSSAGLMALIAPDGLRPAKAKSALRARDAPERVSGREADEFNRRDRR